MGKVILSSAASGNTWFRISQPIPVNSKFSSGSVVTRGVTQFLCQSLGAIEVTIAVVAEARRPFV